MRRYRNQVVFGLALALAVYVGLLLIMDSRGQLTGDVLNHLRSFPVTLLIWCSFTQIAAGFFRFLEWHYYMGVIGAREKISLKNSLIVFVASFTFVVSPGKAAELLKSVLLKIQTGVPVARSAPVVIAERIVDGIAVLFILTISLIFAGDQLDLGTYEATSKAIIYVSVMLIGTGLVVVQIRPLAYFCLRIVERLPLIRRLHGWLLEFYESSREIFSLKHVIPTTIMGIGVYLSTTVGFVLVLYGFGLDITWKLFLQATFMVGVVSAIGALSFVPNGAGVSEISNTVMLAIIVAPTHPEMTPVVAATASLIQGFYHKWFRVVVGLAVAIAYRHRLFPAELEAALTEARHKPQRLDRPVYQAEQ